MPTRKSGPRPPRKRVEHADVEPVVAAGAAGEVALSGAGSEDAALAGALGVSTGDAGDHAARRARSASSEPAPIDDPRAAAGAAPKHPRRNSLFVVGGSLYPLDNETQGAEDWYARDLSDDLDALVEARCGLVRLFVGWRVLEPQVGQYSADVLARLSAVIGAIGERKMQAVVCFFADDRHADLADVSWGSRRDPRSDPYLVQREVALVAEVAGHLRGETGVFAWQLGNEAFLSGFQSADALDAWVDAMHEAIREVDQERPIGLGADAETLFSATGVDAREAIERCEFTVSHTTSAYRAYAAQGPLTSGPSTYLDAFLLRLAHRDRPVLLDEIGTMSQDFSAGEEAAHVRAVLWGGFINRAAGALARRVRDLDTERREPHFVDPFETLVGLSDSDGVPKPAFGELSAFARTVARIDLRTYSLIAERTAVIVPDERYEPLPSLAGLYDPRACLQAFIAAKRAHVPVDVARESDDFSAFSVLVVPSAFNLASDTWERLAAFVQAGGTLLLSYGGGDAHPGIRDLFGVEFLGDGGPRSVLSCRVAQPDVLGALESFDANLEVPNHALLSAGTATIVATDATGSPLLTVNQVGLGRAVYVAVPIERAIAQGDPWATPAAVQHLVREVYGAVARGAGCGAPVTCSAPEVEVAMFQGPDNDVLILLNHSAEKISASLATDRRVASITDVRGGAAVTVGGTVFGVPLAPGAAVALRLAYA